MAALSVYFGSMADIDSSERATRSATAADSWSTAGSNSMSPGRLDARLYHHQEVRGRQIKG